MERESLSGLGQVLGPSEWSPAEKLRRRYTVFRIARDTDELVGGHAFDVKKHARVFSIGYALYFLAGISFAVAGWSEDAPSHLIESVFWYAHFAATPLKDGERLVRTLHGDGLKLSKKSAEEKGTKIDLYFWELAHCAPPAKFYIASFTWTILASQSGDPKFQQEIAFLTNEISRAQFHLDLGKP